MANPCLVQGKAQDIEWNKMVLFQMWLSGIDTVKWIEVWASDGGSALKLMLDINIWIY